MKGKFKRLVQKDIENYVNQNAREIEVIVLERISDNLSEGSYIKEIKNT